MGYTVHGVTKSWTQLSDFHFHISLSEWLGGRIWKERRVSTIDNIWLWRKRRKGVVAIWIKSRVKRCFLFFFFPISERLETCLNIGRREAVERINWKYKRGEIITGMKSLKREWWSLRQEGDGGKDGTDPENLERAVKVEGHGVDSGFFRTWELLVGKDGGREMTAFGVRCS